MKFAKGQIWKSLLNRSEIEIVSVGRWSEGMVTFRVVGDGTDDTFTEHADKLTRWHKLKE
jgi:hypothetical protein